MNRTKDEWLALLKKNGLPLALALAGILLLLFSGSAGKKEPAPEEPHEPDTEESAFSLRSEEARLAEALSQVEGAGRVRVLLAASATQERELAREEDGTAVTESEGSGKRTAVTARFVFPAYTGAVVLAEGADNASVRLSLTEAVRAATGLAADKIVVLKMKSMEVREQ